MTDESSEKNLAAAQEPQPTSSQEEVKSDAQESVKPVPQKEQKPAASERVKPASQQAAKPATKVEAKPAVKGKPSPKPKGTRRNPLAGLGIFIVELIIPLGLAVLGLWVLFGSFGLWSLDRTLALGIFAVALVILSLLVSIFLDSVFTPLRPKRAIGSGARGRLVKFVLAGLILPLGLFAAANLVFLPIGVTPMVWLINANRGDLKVTPADQIADIILQSEDPAARITGIQALEKFKTPDALAQLVRVLNNAPQAFKDASVASAMAKALAAYGADAKAPLLGVFNSVDPSQRSGLTSTQDTYSRYLAPSFDSLRRDLAANSPDDQTKTARLADLDAAQTALQKALADLPAPDQTGGDTRLSVVLHAFVALDLKQDADLLILGKTVAADPTYAPALRGEALLLVAKLGTKDDVNLLAGYLADNSAPVRLKAMEALTVLLDKVGGAGKAK